MPTVSVIMPVYNGEKYIRQAIDSVLSQSYKDWELIVVDDGSTDKTSKILESYHDPRISCLHQSNQGLSSARNAGISKVRGEYVAFLDADDEWEPAFLECCVMELDRNETLAGVYTRNSFIDSRGQILPRLGGAMVPCAGFRARILEGGFFPQHAAVVRSSVVHDVGMFDAGLTSAEDWDFWIRMSKNHQLLAIPLPLARYRSYPGSMSTNAPRMHANCIAVVTKHFGPPTGLPSLWHDEKRRAFGFAYRCGAFRFFQQRQPDVAWELLHQAITVYPALLNRIDTFYEIACGDQPNGIRGYASKLEIERHGADMLARLDGLFHIDRSLGGWRHVAYGNAYLALGMLTDEAKEWGKARVYFARAFRANPSLMASRAIARRFLKLCAGQRLVDTARRLHKRTSHRRAIPT